MLNNFNLEKWKNNKEKLIKNHVYREEDEHSSCGVGLIASIKGTASRKTVEMGIEALKVLYHRGAIDADGKTGDGAGIQIDLPKEFFKEQIERTGHTPSKFPIAVGMIFLPRTNFVSQERSRTIVESEIIEKDYQDTVPGTEFRWFGLVFDARCDPTTYRPRILFLLWQGGVRLE